MEYNECKKIYNLKRKEDPLVSFVPIDEFTNMVQNNFDYTFTGESKFFPYELPKEILNMEFNILALVGASGGGQINSIKRIYGV